MFSHCHVQERKRSAEREDGDSVQNIKIKRSVAASHITHPSTFCLYFSSVSRGLGELSPLSDSLLDEGLLMK